MFAGRLKFGPNGEYDPVNGIPPRYNFDTLLNTLLSIFIVLIGDNWNEMMYGCMRCTNEITAAIYFIILLSFGQFVMLNLFLAIMIGNFD